MKGKDPVDRPYLWGARAMIVALLLVMLLLIRKAWNKKKGAAMEGGGQAASTRQDRTRPVLRSLTDSFARGLQSSRRRVPQLNSCCRLW